MTDLPFRYYSHDQLGLRKDVQGARFCEVSLERSMLTYFELDSGAYFPEHSHQSEQITFVLSGHLVFEIGGEEVVVGPREAIAIPGELPHAVRSVDSVVAVDAWSPPRESLRTYPRTTQPADYRNRQGEP